MKKTTILLVAVLAIFATACHDTVNNQTADEIYANIIASMVRGYQTQWADAADTAVNPVYRMNALTAAYAMYDIDGNGIEELLIGDDFGNGDYALYEIYSFDDKGHKPVLLASGGERDRFVLMREGIIVETGSNSAFDSFEKIYHIDGLQLVEQTPPDYFDTVAVEFKSFLTLACSDAEYVAMKDGVVVGTLVEKYADRYLLEVQDTFSVQPAEVTLELRSALTGDGIVVLNSLEPTPIYAAPDTAATPVAIIQDVAGELPQVYLCRGYYVPALDEKDAFYIIDCNDAPAYLPALRARWYAVNTF